MDDVEPRERIREAACPAPRDSPRARRSRAGGRGAPHPNPRPCRGRSRSRRDAAPTRPAPRSSARARTSCARSAVAPPADAERRRGAAQEGRRGDRRAARSRSVSSSRRRRSRSSSRSIASCGPAAATCARTWRPFTSRLAFATAGRSSDGFRSSLRPARAARIGCGARSRDGAHLAEQVGARSLVHLARELERDRRDRARLAAGARAEAERAQPADGRLEPAVDQAVREELAGLALQRRGRPTLDGPAQRGQRALGRLEAFGENDPVEVEGAVRLDRRGQTSRSRAASRRLRRSRHRTRRRGCRSPRRRRRSRRGPGTPARAVRRSLRDRRLTVVEAGAPVLLFVRVGNRAHEQPLEAILDVDETAVEMPPHAALSPRSPMLLAEVPDLLDKLLELSPDVERTPVPGHPDGSVGRSPHTFMVTTGGPTYIGARHDPAVGIPQRRPRLRRMFAGPRSVTIEV